MLQNITAIYYYVAADQPAVELMGILRVDRGYITT